MSEHRYGDPGDSAAVALVQAIYDAFAHRDIETALQFMAPDCEFFPVGTASRVPGQEGRPYLGHSGVRRYFTDADLVWKELTLYADDVRAVADGVVVFGHVEGIDASGASVRRKVVWLWRMSDGLVTSMRVSEIGDAEPA